MFSRRAVAPLLLWLACVGTADCGEIVFSPVPSDNKKLDEAGALRNKARAYESGNVQTTPSSSDPVIIQKDAAPEIEEGILLPRNNGIPATSWTKNQEHFRDSNLDVQGTLPSGDGVAPAGGQDSQMQLEKNRLKANQYMKGKPAPSLVSPGNNKQVVACESTGNVSGRVGDDTMSGREIVVFRDGRQIKMHCK